jgi:hypothetical protein
MRRQNIGRKERKIEQMWNGCSEMREKDREKGTGRNTE